MPDGKEFGRVGGRFLLRGMQKRDTDAGPANPASLPGVFKNPEDVGGRVFARPSSESLKSPEGQQL
jgi:hypothetical protein